MDETDLKLLRMLQRNPRKSYKQLADSLKISTPAVHKRIRRARESGVLMGPYACISPVRLGAVPTVMLGESHGARFKELAASLGADDRTSLVIAMGGNAVLVKGTLRDVGDLDDYASFVARAAKMADPEILISAQDESQGDGSGKLTNLDLRIIRAMREDGRKAAKDIAAEVGATQKTVRRHLARLRDSGLLAIDLFADQNPSGSIAAVLMIRLEHGAVKRDVGAAVAQKHARAITNMMYFGNQQLAVIGFAWLQSMAELSALVADIEAEKGVASVTPNLVISSVQFDSWVDKLLDDPEKAAILLRQRNLM
jgi:DNA-binding Lrp family transcriptional regulator